MLAGYFFEMMCLVNNKAFIAWKQLMARLHIREQLGVVRDNHISNPCLVFGLMVKALSEPWT
ncbi:hypothetical protein D3C81_1782840 [compost metagenome]